ncbi:MAG: hypothetical protein WEA31_08650, partial [Pirellulales bacterium]
ENASQQITAETVRRLTLQLDPRAAAGETVAVERIVQLAAPRRSRLRTFLAQPIVPSSLIAGLFIAIVLLSLALVNLPDTGDVASSVARQDAVVAQITGLQDVRWAEGATRWRTEMFLPPQAALHLHSGLVELRFNDGATAIVEGPAEFVVATAGGAMLRRGQMFATVPPAAVGFYVDTPTARFVDLSTEFGVAVDDNGAAHAQVALGAIEVRLLHGDASQPVRLTAGQAARVAPGANMVTVEQSSDFRFAQRLAKLPAMMIPAASYTATCSSSFRHRVAERAIDGKGLNGFGEHGTHNESLWHTNIRTAPAASWYQVDLGAVYQLSALRLWNYNGVDPHGVSETHRGIRTADIWVSETGQGDPQSTPEAWQLLRRQQDFAQAPGKPNYTGERIDFAPTAARFVRLDNLSNFGSDRHGDCVGFSEVRFYTLRIK